MFFSGLRKKNRIKVLFFIEFASMAHRAYRFVEKIEK